MQRFAIPDPTLSIPVDVLRGGYIPGRRAGRHRGRVFALVFVVVCVVGLIYTFARPAQYRSVARLEIHPAQTVETRPPLQGGLAVRGSGGNAFLAELHVLTSRPLVQAVYEDLQYSAGMPAEGDGDPVAALQAMLLATPVPETNVMTLEAVGPDAGLLPRIVNGLVAAYQRHLDSTYSSVAADVLADAQDEVAKLRRSIEAKRDEVQQFQGSHGIVSPEREENALLARVRGMADAMTDANTRVVEAEGRLRSLQNAVAQGRSVVRARDNPTLAAIEQRASELREDLSNMERSFTAEYMQLDPDAKAKRARLTELEAQIARERSSGGQATLAEAREELDSAREAARRLQAQLDDERRSAQDFAMRFAQYKAMQAEVDQLQGLHRAALERATKLAASERSRRPQLKLIEPAAVPAEAWRPDYARDAGISVGVALLAALFAVWLVEFIRPEQGDQVVVSPARWMPPWMGAGALPQSGPRLSGVAPELLPAHVDMPRELEVDEARRLLDAASGDTVLVVSGLLAGLSAAELIGLRWTDIDRERRVVRLGQGAARELRLPAPFCEALARKIASPEAPAPTVLHDAAGEPARVEDVEAMVLSAAHDAVLADPGSVTPASLRHTYIAHLVRQGVRFADLAAVVGHLPREELTAYSALAPAGARLDAERIAWMHPAQEVRDR